MTKKLEARPEDVSSVDAIISIDYKLLSGRADEKRDWDRMRTLFAPGARLIPIERDENGIPMARVFTIDQYIKSRTPMLAAGDFYEIETHREERREGRLAQVWSSYVAVRAPGGDPIRRGANSFQLWNDGARWWILSIAWDAISAAEL
jgi:hypothetical protein